MRAPSGVVRSTLLALGIIAFFAGSVFAQSSGGAISGNVLDPSGAVIPGATLIATGANTNTSYTAISTSTGSYRISEMTLGTYSLSATAPGFKQTNLTGILVQVNSVSSIDVHLSPGGTSETVTVSADAPTVQTQSSDVGSVVDTRQIIELPLSLGGQGNLRSPEAFIFLTPGTTGPGSAGNNNGAFQSKIAGGQNFGAEVLIDGASTQRADSASAFDQTAPSVEALQEFKVTTSTIPAEFGRTTGGVESFSIKSGTNSYHGSFFDIFQNEAMNANDWFKKYNLSKLPNPTPDDIKAAARDLDRKNDYGVSLGGPAWIPKIYNGRDRTFLFFSWEQFRQNQSATNTSTLPTNAARSGDFSSQLTNIPTDKGVLDCNGNKVFQGEIFDPNTTSTFNGKPCRKPFPGNIIPPDRISQVAKNVLAFIPTVNPAAGATNNFTFRTGSPILNTTMAIRLDQNLTQKSKIYASYSSRDNVARNGNNSLPDPIANNAQFAEQFTHYARAGWDYVFTPTMLNHLNLGFNRVLSPNHSGAVNGTDWPQKLGIKGANGPTFPVFTFASDLGYPQIGQNNDALQASNAVLVADSVSLSKGAHDIKVGLDWRNAQLSNANNAGFSGEYDFQRFQTAAVAGDGTTGDGFASFLLGQVDTNSFTITAKAPRFVSNYYAGFVQDNFKVLHNLVLNLGLRYDVETPRHESHGNVSNFSPTTPNAGADGLPGAIVFAGAGAGRIGGLGSFAKTWRKDFAPRLGFAYAPDAADGRMSIRGGFGIYYGPLDYADFGNGTTLGFAASPSFNKGDKFSQAYPGGLDGGVPSFPKPPNLDPTQANGQGGGGFGGLEYIAPSYGRPSMTLNWSLEVQQQLATDLILTIGYVGQSSSHLRSSLAQINDLNPKFFNLGIALNQPTNVFPFPGFSGTLAQALRPFPQYQAINTDCCLENVGHSSYNALLVKLERRFHNGLNLLASYTWSKTLTDADSALPAFATFSGGGSVQNPTNLKGEKALSNQDIPQTFVLSYIYELPVGSGKKYLNHSKVANAVVGGWQVGAVHRYQSGQPLNFSCAPTSVSAFDGCIRWNQIAPLRNPAYHGGSPRDPQNFNIFNRAAFSDPNADIGVPGTPFRFGDMPRVTGELRTPLYINEDVSVIKHLTNFGEFGSLQLHADAFNVFNRHVFNRPDTNVPTTPVNTFGQFSSDIDTPRILQLTLRYTF